MTEGGGSGGLAVNVAVAECADVIDSWHVGAVPAQSPDQPVKVEPESAAAVSVTELPGAKACEQVEPQEIPAGLLVTVPLPPVDTVRSGSATNVAVAERPVVIESWQVVAVPEQAPDQPVNVECAAHRLSVGEVVGAGRAAVDAGRTRSDRAAPAAALRREERPQDRADR